MTDHPLTETTAAVTAEPLARTILSVPDGHGAAHHDADQIKAGDFVAQMDRDGFIRAGFAHLQRGNGNWGTESGGLIAWAAERADRPDALTVWPAPTPPAEEVELPTERPAHITDVTDRDGDTCAYMALDYQGWWRGVDQNGAPRQWNRKWLAAFTLPDGTRARRDGQHEDGTPRFIKEGEK